MTLKMAENKFENARSNFISVVVNFKNLRFMTLVKENSIISDLIKEVESTFVELYSVKVKIRTLKNVVNAVLPHWYPVAPLLQNQDEVFAFTDNAADEFNSVTNNGKLSKNTATLCTTMSPCGSGAMADSGFTSPAMTLGAPGRSEDRRQRENAGINEALEASQEGIVVNRIGENLSQDEGNELLSEVFSLKDNPRTAPKQKGEIPVESLRSKSNKSRKRSTNDENESSLKVKKAKSGTTNTSAKGRNTKSALKKSVRPDSSRDANGTVGDGSYLEDGKEKNVKNSNDVAQISKDISKSNDKTDKEQGNDSSSESSDVSTSESDDSSKITKDAKKMSDQKSSTVTKNNANTKNINTPTRNTNTSSKTGQTSQKNLAQGTTDGTDSSEDGTGDELMQVDQKNEKSGKNAISITVNTNADSLKKRADSSRSSGEKTKPNENMGVSVEKPDKGNERSRVNSPVVYGVAPDSGKAEDATKSCRKESITSDDSSEDSVTVDDKKNKGIGETTVAPGSASADKEKEQVTDIDTPVSNTAKKGMRKRNVGSNEKKTNGKIVEEKAKSVSDIGKNSNKLDTKKKPETTAKDKMQDNDSSDDSSSSSDTDSDESSVEPSKQPKHDTEEQQLGGSSKAGLISKNENVSENAKKVENISPKASAKEAESVQDNSLGKKEEKVKSVSNIGKNSNKVDTKKKPETTSKDKSDKMQDNDSSDDSSYSSYTDSDESSDEPSKKPKHDIEEQQLGGSSKAGLISKNKNVSENAKKVENISSKASGKETQSEQDSSLSKKGENRKAKKTSEEVDVSSDSSTWCSKEEVETKREQKTSKNVSETKIGNEKVESRTGSQKDEDQTDVVDGDKSKAGSSTKGKEKATRKPARAPKNSSKSETESGTKSKSKRKNVKLPPSPAKSVGYKKNTLSKNNAVSPASPDKSVARIAKSVSTKNIADSTKAKKIEVQAKSDDEDSKNTVSTLKAPFTQLPAKDRVKSRGDAQSESGDDLAKEDGGGVGEKDKVKRKKKSADDKTGNATAHTSANEEQPSDPNTSLQLPRSPKPSSRKSAALLSASKVTQWLLSNPVSEDVAEMSGNERGMQKKSITCSKNKTTENRINMESLVDNNIPVSTSQSQKRKVDEVSQQGMSTKSMKSKKKKETEDGKKQDIQQVDGETQEKQEKPSTKRSVTNNKAKKTSLSLPKVSKGLAGLAEDESDYSIKSGTSNKKRKLALPAVSRRWNTLGFLTPSKPVRKKSATSLKNIESLVKKISSSRPSKAVEMNAREREFVDSGLANLDTILKDESIKW